MKITNFQRLSLNRATVDVTTGFLWFRKTETKRVALSAGLDWFFVDSGEFTPDYDVDKLARSADAKDTFG